MLNLGGMVAGMVFDATTLAAHQIGPAPGMGGVVACDYLIGPGTFEQRSLILILIDKLMASLDIGPPARSD